MGEIFASAYVTNLLLVAGVILLFRIAAVMSEIYAVRRELETTVKILHQSMPDRGELIRVVSFMAEELEKSREKLREIAALQEAIIRRMPGGD